LRWRDARGRHSTWRASTSCPADGDLIELDVPARSLELRVPAAELARRKAEWQPAPAHYPRGFGWIHLKHVTQANEGCDFDFLRGTAPIPEPKIY
jgi:hypothetical protein